MDSVSYSPPKFLPLYKVGPLPLPGTHMQFTMMAGARLQFSDDPEKKIIFAAEISGRYLVGHLFWPRKGNYWVGQKVHPGFGNPINAAIIHLTAYSM